ncbi:hypothetical protein C723_2512 [Christiangramia flava JLT2011]|uniref:Uncharacterized protein n=1 Tax=Christiangramia flava JLT2011 TaxID=1229726 RepID=A0A1L7I5W8_9FLAO|nr:hypothetical protein GRFL_2273 [Christiangramia flava JLT2011]OSS38529.1 hypothetical protein C723_2512 [Christiangramia flava JLT2011]
MVAVVGFDYWQVKTGRLIFHLQKMVTRRKVLIFHWNSEDIAARFEW